MKTIDDKLKGVKLSNLLKKGGSEIEVNLIVFYIILYSTFATMTISVDDNFL